MDEAFRRWNPLMRTDMQNLLIELQGELQKDPSSSSPTDLDESLPSWRTIVILERTVVVASKASRRHILLNPFATRNIEEFCQPTSTAARVLRVRPVHCVKTTENKPATLAARVITNDNLESLIEKVRRGHDKPLSCNEDGQQGWTPWKGRSGTFSFGPLGGSI